MKEKKTDQDESDELVKKGRNAFKDPNSEI